MGLSTPVVDLTALVRRRNGTGWLLRCEGWPVEEAPADNLGRCGDLRGLLAARKLKIWPSGKQRTKYIVRCFHLKNNVKPRVFGHLRAEKKQRIRWRR